MNFFQSLLNSAPIIKEWQPNPSNVAGTLKQFHDQFSDFDGSRKNYNNLISFGTEGALRLVRIGKSIYAGESPTSPDIVNAIVDARELQKIYRQEKSAGVNTNLFERLLRYGEQLGRLRDDRISSEIRRANQWSHNFSPEPIDDGSRGKDTDRWGGTSANTEPDRHVQGTLANQKWNQRITDERHVFWERLKQRNPTEYRRLEENGTIKRTYNGMVPSSSQANQGT